MISTIPRELDAGACRAGDPELHWPVTEHGPAAAAQISAAKRVCHTCPVLAICRAHAIQNEPHGIWGGLTEAERTALRRQAAETATAASTAAVAATDRSEVAA
jgi:WhiB family redox-sensing transcriptional regulator